MKISEDKVRQIIREELIRLAEQDDPKSPSMNDLEFMSDDRIAYEQWAKLNGHETTEVESVLIDYIVDQSLESNHDLHKKLAKEFGFSHADMMDKIEGDPREDRDTRQSEKILDLEQVIEAISKI